MQLLVSRRSTGRSRERWTGCVDRRGQVVGRCPEGVLLPSGALSGRVGRFCGRRGASGAYRPAHALVLPFPVLMQQVASADGLQSNREFAQTIFVGSGVVAAEQQVAAVGKHGADHGSCAAAVAPFGGRQRAGVGE